MLDKMQSENINEIAVALAKMQQNVGSIAKNKTANLGGKYKFTYADLCAILDAVRKPLTDAGLAITQTFYPEDGTYHIVSMLLHSSGQWLKSYLPINVGSVDIKQLGAQITYSRRYALASLLGICADDDNEENLEGNAVTPSNSSYKADAKISEKQLDLLVGTLKKFTPEQVGNLEKAYAKECGITEWNELPRDKFQDLYDKLNKRLIEGAPKAA